ncbi:Endonuclease/Exonuclease/phosphatase family protein [Posidoniimonas corsicana]|uniref:Endonuclease/Exonuclease/phosphatase family protein n=1 Tax=Posidoniimonas corsicana TaxID=1938618 RepID=A0A5C5VHM4_9BACT|nr:endonuclease/exonuclease/phosphatase family protein [Posidoniimonas corsicana]TWT37245.1 Endonuclease/Exonuclease/phosphatase family protein [Posidoniimonas corsicana]
MARRVLTDAANGLARVVALAGLFSILLTACGQLLGRLWWPLELPCHFTAYYAAALLIATPLFLLPGPHRRRRLGVAAAVALVLNVWLLSPYLLPAGVPSRDQLTVRVMTLNVLTSNQRHDDVLRLVEQVDPDVLALIEVDRSWMADLAPLFAKFPTAKTLPRSDNFGVALFSKLPTESLEVIELANSEVPSIRATLLFEGQPITVLATHPLPPIGAENARLRNDHLAAIAEWSLSTPGEQVVVGDLNVTPWSPYFRSLLNASRLNDSATGRWLRTTWRVGRNLIGIPIDHALHTDGLKVVDRQIGPDVGSDHRAVIVEFVSQK